MPDGDEDAIGVEQARGAALHIFHAGVRDRRRVFATKNLVDRMVEQNVYVGVRREPLLQYAFRAKPIAATHWRDMRGDIGDVKRFLHRRIAATDDQDFLAPKEEAVASGTSGDAIALEPLLTRNLQPFDLGASGYDQRVACIEPARIRRKV